MPDAEASSLRPGFCALDAFQLGLEFTLSRIENLRVVVDGEGRGAQVGVPKHVLNQLLIVEGIPKLCTATVA